MNIFLTTNATVTIVIRSIKDQIGILAVTTIPLLVSIVLEFLEREETTQ